MFIAESKKGGRVGFLKVIGDCFFILVFCFMHKATLLMYKGYFKKKHIGYLNLYLTQ